MLRFVSREVGAGVDQPAAQLSQGASVEAYNRNRAELRRLQCLDAVANKEYVAKKRAQAPGAA